MASTDTSPLDNVYQNRNGHPFSEWIISHKVENNGWWGEGYIMRTIEPAMLLKWGYASSEEVGAMSASCELEDGLILSVLRINEVHGLKHESFEELAPSLNREALIAIKTYLDRNEQQNDQINPDLL